MKKGYLSEYFAGVAIKTMAAVEADLLRSHQHEFNGVAALHQLFGAGRQEFPAKFIYLADTDDEPLIESATLTWYDARENHPTRTEYRLYFPSTRVSKASRQGDLLVIARRPDNTVLVVVAAAGSTAANQVQWLFGADAAQSGYTVREHLDSERDRLAFASRTILEAIGVVVEAPGDAHLEEMLDRFEGEFPSTWFFSEYARSTLRELDWSSDPDLVLMSCMEREEALFRSLERHLIEDRLKHGFAGDVDGFIAYSLSVQNRRKSRVGLALENHLEHLFLKQELHFDRTAVTENKARPDFLFPGASHYQDQYFSAPRLTMLGVKSTCKDRWRQVLAEADRIEEKHLLTLETAISINQTQEMQAKNLQLVVPRQLHETYGAANRDWLMPVGNFIELVRERQLQAGITTVPVAKERRRRYGKKS